MSCREHEAVVEYARGVTLEPDRAAAVERHIAACPRCAHTLERERALSADLRRLAAESRSLGARSSVEQAVLEAFDAAWASARTNPSRAPDSPSPGLWAHRRIVQLTAAAALVAVACGFVWWPFAGRPVTEPVKKSQYVVSALRPFDELRVVPSPVEGRQAQGVPSLSRDGFSRTTAAPPKGGRDGDFSTASTGGSSADSASPPVRPSVVTGTRRMAAPSQPRRYASEFVPWPNAEALPAFESGELLRLDLPSSMLSSLGLGSPGSNVTAVTADVLVGQDGLARAVRLVQ